MGIKKSIKQQNSKQKRHIAPKSKEFRSWILRKVIDNGKNNSLNIWILDNPKIWGTHLNRCEVVMRWTWQVQAVIRMRKQPTLHDATTHFLAKWCLRKERRNSILMTHHYPDLGSASDRTEANFPHGMTNPKHYPVLGSDASSVWNFCARFSDITSSRNQWWCCEMLAVFSG